MQGIMVVVFIKTNIQYKMMNTTTMIPCGHISWRKLAIIKMQILLQVVSVKDNFLQLAVVS